MLKTSVAIFRNLWQCSVNDLEQKFMSKPWSWKQNDSLDTFFVEAENFFLCTKIFHRTFLILFMLLCLKAKCEKIHFYWLDLFFLLNKKKSFLFRFLRLVMCEINLHKNKNLSLYRFWTGTLILAIKSRVWKVKKIQVHIMNPIFHFTWSNSLTHFRSNTFFTLLFCICNFSINCYWLTFNLLFFIHFNHFLLVFFFVLRVPKIITTQTDWLSSADLA